MSRPKKQHLKQRPDGRYVTYYKGKAFYGRTESEAFDNRDAYKRSELTGEAYNKTITVYEYGSKWIKIAHPAVAEKTYAGYALHLQHLVNQLGNTPICEVKPLEIKAVYSTEYKNASNGYLKAAKQFYCNMFDAAVADGICKSNPARVKSAAPHKGKVGSHRAITNQEREWINTLCLDHPFHAAVIVMLYAGLRPQEAKAMTIEKAYDPDNGVLHITECAHLDGLEYVITNVGKTKKSIRDVPLLPPVEEALKGKKGLLITKKNGEKIGVNSCNKLYRTYQTAMERAINGCRSQDYGKLKKHKQILAEGGKLPEWIKFTVVPYDLRHSFCTMCRDNGVELHTCIEWMGHSDATMIMRIYDEVSSDRSKKEAEKLRKRFLNGQIDGQIKKKTPDSVDNQSSTGSEV